MTDTRLALASLTALLRRPATDPLVRDLIQCDPHQIERFEYTGFVELKDQGVSVMFAEAPHVIPNASSQELLVSAFHLHADGHEGYNAYRGALPNGIKLGDSEDQLIAKMGGPGETGGGGWSQILQQPIPRWYRYGLHSAVIQFQISSGGGVEMVTLDTSDPLRVPAHRV
jgi:hypothetical protein